MTLEEQLTEAQNKLATLEAAKVTDDAKITELETQRSNQNSYITKLEGKIRVAENNTTAIKEAVNKTPQKDYPDEIVEYFQKVRREDYVRDAKTEIVSRVGEEVFNIFETELMDFLKKYMSNNTMSVKYIVDSFDLIYGRAMSNKDHAIHKLNTKSQPVVTQTMVPNTSALNAQMNTLVTNVMTPDDSNAGGAPVIKAQPIANTKDAMNKLKDKFILNQNKFE